MKKLYLYFIMFITSICIVSAGSQFDLVVSQPLTDGNTDFYWYGLAYSANRNLTFNVTEDICLSRWNFSISSETGMTGNCWLEVWHKSEYLGRSSEQTCANISGGIHNFEFPDCIQINGSTQGYKVRGNSTNTQANNGIIIRINQGNPYSDGGREKAENEDPVFAFYTDNRTGAPPELIFNITYPANNSRVNDIPLNFLVNVTQYDGNVSCNLMNASDLLYTAENVSYEVEIPLIYSTYEDQESNTTYNITCYDNSANNITTNHSVSVEIDNIFPLLAISHPLNNSYYQSSMPVEVNCTDNFVYRLNYTLFNSSHIITALEYTNATDNVIELIDTVNTGSIADGIYYINFTCADSHTAKEIDEYGISAKSKEISFFTPDKITISSSSIDSMTTEKQTDRYTLDVSLSKGSHTFTLKTEKRLTYIADSGFPCHLITDKNWIDFATAEPSSCIAERITDYEYNITVTSNEEKLTFNSVGDLNVNSEQYPIYVNNEEPILIINYPTNNTFINMLNFDYEINSYDEGNQEFYCELIDYTGVNNTVLAYFDLDEGSGSIIDDQSNNDYKGYLLNMEAGDWINGVYNTGLDFDGIDEAVTGGNILDFEKTDSYTIAFWKNDSGDDGSLVSKAEPSGDYTGWMIEATSAGYIYSYLINSYPSNMIQKRSNTATINDGKWHHVAVTYNGSTNQTGMKIYIDGVEQAYTLVYDLLTGSTESPANFSIGSRNNTFYFYNGAMDDIYIFNRAFTSQEVSDLYNYSFNLGGSAYIYDSGLFAQGIINLTYTNTIDDNYSATVICYDNTPLNLSSERTSHFTIDTTSPTLNIYVPLNNSLYNRNETNETINISCTDDNVDWLNLTIYNESGEVISQSINDTPTGNELTITQFIEYSTLAVGYYNVTAECLDYANNIEEVTHIVRLVDENPANPSLVLPLNNSLVTIDMRGRSEEIAEANTNFTYFVENIANCSIYLNSILVNSIETSLGNNTITALIEDNSFNTWYVFCQNDIIGLNETSEMWQFNVSILQSEFYLTRNECPSTTQGILILYMFVGMAFLLILMGFYFKIGLIGVFGSLMLFIVSWYISPCQNLLAFFIGSLALVLILWFALAGLGFIGKN